eukprot:766387-Hanusia_phi.AAC.3
MVLRSEEQEACSGTFPERIGIIRANVSRDSFERRTLILLHHIHAAHLYALHSLYLAHFPASLQRAQCVV